MPKNRTLSVMFATFPYAGNSTGSSLNWPTSEWLTKTFCRLKTEEKFTSRMHALGMDKFADTPITMTRNKAVFEARRQGFDIFCDSPDGAADGLILRSAGHRRSRCGHEDDSQYTG